jgi:hypothetical protein
MGVQSRFGFVVVKEAARVIVIWCTSGAALLKNYIPSENVLRVHARTHAMWRNLACSRVITPFRTRSGLFVRDRAARSHANPIAEF